MNAMLDLPTVLAGPPKPSRILSPRDLQRRSGGERYEIPGGGAVMVELDQGDQVSVMNPEGGQEAEILAADHLGRIDGAVIGVKTDQTGEGLKALIAQGGPGMARLRQGSAGTASTSAVPSPCGFSGRRLRPRRKPALPPAKRAG